MKTTVPLNTENPVVEEAAEVTDNLEPEPKGVHDITNTSMRRSTRLTGKEPNTSKRGGENRFTQPSVQSELLSKPRHQPRSEEKEVQPPKPRASARPSRSTRSRVAKSVVSSTDESALIEPVRRSTRASSRRAAKQIQESMASEIDADVVTSSCVKKMEPGSGLQSPGLEVRTKDCLSLKNVSNCRVSLERVKSPTTTSPSSATPPKGESPSIVPPRAISPKGTSPTTVPPPSDTHPIGEPSTVDPPPVNSPRGEPPTAVSPPSATPPGEAGRHKQQEKANGHLKVAEDKQSSEATLTSESSHETTSATDGVVDDDAEKACPPKRSISMKLRKKGKGRGTRKGAGRGRKGAAAATRKTTPIPILEEKEGEVSLTRFCIGGIYAGTFYHSLMELSTID